MDRIMSCIFCKIVKYSGQYALNWLNLLDHLGNTLLLGDSDETISARTARAREAGQRWAHWFCKLLTVSTKFVTFGAVTRDHCDYALDKNERPNSREIWNWSTMSLNETPIGQVRVIEEPEDPLQSK